MTHIGTNTPRSIFASLLVVIAAAGCAAHRVCPAEARTAVTPASGPASSSHAAEKPQRAHRPPDAAAEHAPGSQPTHGAGEGHATAGPAPGAAAHPHGGSPQHHSRHGVRHTGGMPHRFRDAKKWARRFDDPKRDRWQKPAAVLDALGLRADMQIADIGAGTGYFAVRLARRVPQGKVWGIDVEPDMVRYLEARARREKLPNLHGRLASFESPRIPEPVDLIFICNTYHHIADRPAYFRRVAKQLRPAGRLVIVDFVLGQIPVGPPPGHRVGPEQLDRELQTAGYRRVRLDEQTLPYQYIAIYELR